MASHARQRGAVQRLRHQILQCRYQAGRVSIAQIGGVPVELAQRGVVLIGADVDADAGDALCGGLGQRACGVAACVSALVAVVVGEAVGQHHHQAVGVVAVGAEQRVGVADRGAHARQPGWRQRGDAFRRDAGALVEALDPHEAHPLATPRMKAEARDAIAEALERIRQPFRDRAVALQHSETVGALIGGRARNVEQQQYGQIAAAGLGRDVNVLVRGMAAAALHAEVDQRIEVELLALIAAAHMLVARADARQRGAETGQRHRWRFGSAGIVLG
ncbi:conserved hypothetical protein, partial [Ricinus communis]